MGLARCCGMPDANIAASPRSPSITPKVMQVKRLDEVGFGYGFYPIINPHFDGENPIKLGSEQDFTALRGG